MIRLSSHVHWDILISFKQGAAGPEFLSRESRTDRSANNDGKRRSPVEVVGVAEKWEASGDM